MPSVMTSPGYRLMREVLVAQASEQVAQYPQYGGHFDSHVLVTIRRDEVSKGGPSFERGDVAIASPIPRADSGEVTFSVWSAMRGGSCAVPQSNVEFVAICD